MCRSSAVTRSIAGLADLFPYVKHAVQHPLASAVTALREAPSIYHCSWRSHLLYGQAAAALLFRTL